MLNPDTFYNFFLKNGIEFFTGVPDSLLANFIAVLSKYENNIIVANEGGALALAAGYHLATSKVPLVYMQNSGFGNVVNPLTSLIDKEVYSIPVLLLIGWRGEPGINDEPQHKKQGRISQALLKTLEIKHDILSKDEKTAEHQIREAKNYMVIHNEPFALLVQKESFHDNEINIQSSEYSLSRELAIQIVLSQLPEHSILVSTTGKASREVFEYRVNRNQSNENDFLTVGCMGHASKIALGIAINQSKRNVFCLDGDGAAIMHLGALAIIGNLAGFNFKHVILNNGSHDSVGGQPTVGHKIDFLKIAEACNYRNLFTAVTEEELRVILPEFISKKGPNFLEIKVANGARSNLGRPINTPIENKNALMDYLNSSSHEE